MAQRSLSGTFEHARNHLTDHAVDLSHSDAPFRNDETGATAYLLAMQFAVVLFAYSRGIASSRRMGQTGREHVKLIALSSDTPPHFPTIAHSLSTVGEDMARVFEAVVAISASQGLLCRKR